MTQRLAVACARHPWRTVAAWIGAIVVAFVLVGALLGANLTGEGNVTNNPESLRANDLRSARFPQQERASTSSSSSARRRCASSDERSARR